MCMSAVTLQSVKALGKPRGMLISACLRAQVHKGVRRVIAIWDERKVFGALGIKPFLEAADNAEATGSGELHIAYTADFAHWCPAACCWIVQSADSHACYCS